MDANLLQIILGLSVGLLTLIVLVVWTRVHAFPALIIAAILAGVLGGYGFAPTLASIKKGFGGTLGGIGIVIGFGVILGAIFEMSGAAKRMALFFLKIFGKGREEYALAATGFVVSIPIFCDSGFIILAPLAKAIARNTGKSLITLGVALGAGLAVTHTLVPPTPGPLIVVANFGLDIGTFLLWSLIFSLPLVLVALLYARYIGQKIVSEMGEFEVPSDDGKELPSTFMSFFPILLPLVLIVLSTVLNALGYQASTDSPFMVQLLHNLGNPIVAVGLGLLVALCTLTRGFSKDEAIGQTDEAIKQAGIIIFVTGGGGALGMVLRDSGAGAAIADALVQWNIPSVILPILISTLVRFVQGSGTVALVTSSAIVAPIVAAGTLSVSPTLAALGCCVGGLFCSHFNDSYFWVVNRILGLTSTAKQLRAWSITTGLSWATGVVILIVLDLFL